MNRRYLIAGGLGALLIASTAVGLVGWQAEHRRVKALESLVGELQRKEKRSAVDRSISAQMEEIAFEQMIISDEQREKALQQTRVANEMRERSEIERQNALMAERNAVASEKKALEASALAESQRQIAEHQRIQAELAKSIADTLSYVALARSLGSLSSIQAQVGNTELADLLAYSSYLFVSRYHGDVYYPAIFQSLMTSSQSMRSWPKHSGSLMANGATVSSEPYTPQTSMFFTASKQLANERSFRLTASVNSASSPSVCMIRPQGSSSRSFSGSFRTM